MPAILSDVTMCPTATTTQFLYITFNGTQHALFLYTFSCLVFCPFVFCLFVCFSLASKTFSPMLYPTRILVSGCTASFPIESFSVSRDFACLLSHRDLSQTERPQYCETKTKINRLHRSENILFFKHGSVPLPQLFPYLVVYNS